MCTIVYKLGGSLLSLPDLVARLQRLIVPLEMSAHSSPDAGESQAAPPPQRLLIVGGGKTADRVREWDRIHRLGDERAHRLALLSMTLNAALIAEILPNAQRVGDRTEAREAWQAERVAVLDPSRFLEAEEKNSGERLPRSWDVTSDSIAAYVALRWPADALVLVKSIPSPAGQDAATAARGRSVDLHFPLLAGRIAHVDWVNLRDQEPAVVRWIESEPLRHFE